MKTISRVFHDIVFLETKVLFFVTSKLFLLNFIYRSILTSCIRFLRYCISVKSCLYRMQSDKDVKYSWKVTVVHIVICWLHALILFYLLFHILLCIEISFLILYYFISFCNFLKGYVFVSFSKSVTLCIIFMYYTSNTFWLRTYIIYNKAT